MRPNTSRTRIAAVMALTAAVLTAQGCVVAIGNRGGKDDAERIRLTSSERESATVIRDGGTLPDFAEVERARLAGLGPSTTVGEFTTAFPEAVCRGSRTVQGQDIVVYEVRDQRLYRFEGSSYGKFHDRPVFFRFVDGELESWRTGRESDGPKQWFNLEVGS